MKIRLLATSTVLFYLLTINLQLSALALGTAFTYQGRLNSGGTPANGSYDLKFTLYDDASVGSNVGASLTNAAAGVSNGLFTVTLDFGAGVFDGNARWLEIGVRTNGGSAFTTLAPRQQLTPTPYALYAPAAGTAASANSVAAANISGTIGLAQLPGAVVTNNATGAMLTGEFTGNGTGLSNVNAAALNGLGASNIWQLGGNAGTTPGTHFLGTTDNQPLELRVDNQRGLRLEPVGTNSVNVVGGWWGNGVAAGAIGATVAGGGVGNLYGSAYTNRVEADFGTVSGGAGNRIQTGGTFSTIGGGLGNTIWPNASAAIINGGSWNTIWSSAWDATIGGGDSNTIQTNSPFTTIGGGYYNTIQTNAISATIGGGDSNTIKAGGSFATIPGGYQNSATNCGFAAGYRAKANHLGAFVWADYQFVDFTSTANNQFLIRASGNVGINKNNPATTLDVNGTVAAGNFSLSGPPYGDVKLRDDAYHGLGWYGTGKLFAGVNVNGPVLYGGSGGALGATASGQVIALAWNNSGNVGIGTATPDANLTINGSAYSGVESSFVGTHIKNTADGGDATLWLQTSTKNAYLRLKNNYDSTWLKLDDGATTRMVIGLNGNVGIGKTSPATALDVNGTVTATSFSGSGSGLTGVPAANLSGTVPAANLADNSITSAKLANDPAALTKVAGGRLMNQGANVLVQGAGGAIDTTKFTGLGFQYDFASGEGAILSSYDDGYGFLSFYTKPGAGQPATKRMIIDRNGLVGIGKPAPATALDVNGTVAAGNFALSGPSFGDLKLRNDDFHGLGWYGAGKLFAGANVNGPVLYGGSGGMLGATGNGPVAALTWDNAGKVGIGTSSPGARLEVNGNAMFNGIFANLDVVDLSFLANSAKMFVGWNLAHGPGETDFIANRGPGSVGGFGFYDVANDATINQLMSLTGAGSVGIGTSLPYAKLHVLASGADCTIRSETAAASAAAVLEVTAPGGHGALVFGGSSYPAWGGPLSLNLLNAADGPMTFGHFVNGGGYEWMRITSAGNVGIGTAAPAYKLDVAGDLHTSGAVWSYGWIWCNFADGWNRLDKSGSTAFWTTSDERLKQDIAPIPNAVATLQKLRGVSWQWNDAGLQHLTRDIEASWKSTSGKPEDDQKLWAEKRRAATAQLSKPQMGFVAQEVEQVFPDWVKTDEQGYKQVNVERLGAVLVNAVKEQQTQLEAQRRELNLKEAELQLLKARLAAIEARLNNQVAK